MSRERIDLCGLWRFQPDLAWEGEKCGYSETEYDDRRWHEARLPEVFDALHPGLDAYEGAVWFRRRFTVSHGWRGKRVVVCFHAVNYHAKVWVNGCLMGEHADGFLPFSFSVGEQLNYGADNTVVVRADNVRREGEVPGMQRGWRTFGGILREIELVATDPLYLDHVTIRARPRDDGGQLDLEVEVENGRSSPAEAVLRASVVDGEGRELATLSSQPSFLESGSSLALSLQGFVEGVAPWSPASPNLYRAEIELRVGDEIVDQHMVRMGFRQIEARNGQLLLNGRPIYLTGFNRHEDSPQRNMAADLETARRDLVEMQAAGANFCRLCHYPHHPGELDLCDELGLLVMDEIPLYWWDGYQEGEENCRTKLDAARRQVREMIWRDINHPSVVFWSVSNENQEDRPEVAEGNRQLVQWAKDLDPSRLAVHVSDHWRSHPNFAGDDVICVNAYPSLNARGYEGDYGYDLSESTRFWQEGLAALHERYPDKPILISEFGYAALQGVYEGAFGEDAQAEAIESEFAGMGAPYVCGATVWCWADHPWPAATFRFSRYLAISPYGVVSRERRKLRAYWAIRKLFRERQATAIQAGTVAPRPGAAGYGLIMVRPHMDGILQVAFPEGFGIRPMRPGEGGLWLDIQRDAEPYFAISDSLFMQEFGHDLQSTLWRSFIVTNHKGVGVGTISAWRNCDYRGQDYGMIHWVAIRQAYQGKGLGKAAMSFALNQLAQWHDRCYLATQSRRCRAIGMYLDFGFVPDLEAAGAIEGWRDVKAGLRHPVLDGIKAL